MITKQTVLNNAHQGTNYPNVDRGPSTADNPSKVGTRGVSRRKRPKEGMRRQFGALSEVLLLMTILLVLW